MFLNEVKASINNNLDLASLAKGKLSLSPRSPSKFIHDEKKRFREKLEEDKSAISEDFLCIKHEGDKSDISKLSMDIKSFDM